MHKESQQRRADVITRARNLSFLILKSKGTLEERMIQIVRILIS